MPQDLKEELNVAMDEKHSNAKSELDGNVSRFGDIVQIAEIEAEVMKGNVNDEKEIKCDVFQPAKQLAEETTDEIKDTVEKAEASESANNAIVNKANEWKDSIQQSIDGVKESIDNTATDWNNKAHYVFYKLNYDYRNAKDDAEAKKEEIIKSVESTASDVKEYVSDTVESVKDRVVETKDTLAEVVSDTTESLKSTASDLMQRLQQNDDEPTLEKAESISEKLMDLDVV